MKSANRPTLVHGEDVVVVQLNDETDRVWIEALFALTHGEL
jgi:hypothetical protein